MSSKLTPRLAFLLTLPPLLWAGNAVVGRLAVGHVPPITLNALRWLLAFVVLLPLGWKAFGTAQARREVLARWRPLALLGLLGVGCYNALQYLALTTSTALNVTLIASSMPVWMLAIGALFYRERPTRRAVAGAALSLAGVLVVLARGDLAQLAQVRFVPGDLFMLVAIVAWAFYSWLLARPAPSLAGAQRPDWDWAAFLLVQIAFGLVWSGLSSGLELALAPFEFRWPAWMWAVIAYVAIGPAVIAYRCWGLGVAEAGPAMAAIFGNLTPLFAAVMSAALLGEAPHAYHAFAFALLVAGIAVSARR